MNQLVGQQLGNYRLSRLLGQGGFADVYLGEHVQLGKKVAVKVLKIAYSEARFRQEAQILWDLRHPHIVEIREYGVEGNIPYLVMEYAARGSLCDLHKSGEQVPQASILAYLKQIASALQYVHDKNLIHCDIKPQNFLVRANGEVLLSDFGITTEALTSTLRFMSLPNSQQTIIGTIDYIAPEQWQFGRLTPAVDQYALGIVVYEWLCGQRPFRGLDPQSVGHAHLHDDPPPFNDSSISSELEDVVMRALAKDPAHRFPSIQDFAVALEQAMQNSSGAVSLAQNVSTNTPSASGSRLWDQLVQANQFPPIATSGPHAAPTIQALPKQLQANTPPSLWGQNPNTPPLISRPTVDFKKRQPIRFEWNSLFDENNRFFLVIGSVYDFFCMIPLLLAGLDINVAIGLPLFAIGCRLFCTAALRPRIARPFAWFLVVYEIFVLIELLVHFHSSFYVLLLIFAILSWLLNDFFYAKKK